jgi:hypothetical protein
LMINSVLLGHTSGLARAKDGSEHRVSGGGTTLTHSTVLTKPKFIYAKFFCGGQGAFGYVTKNAQVWLLVAQYGAVVCPTIHSV